MKFFSLFKSEKYQRFEYQPRYFDPAKEELKRRILRAKGEYSSSGAGFDKDHTPIRDAFARKHSRDRGTSLLQMVIFAVLVGAIAGWLYFGNDFFYYFYLPLMVPAYLYFRFKKKTS